ncbi:hypothetical protein GCM10009827_101070 [Dactylosporangium maewongense]|uniref:Uncharacterized protein n=1 Tax=Dactylosporangium maewongense TaxID=634393 RepID=A0ABN2CV68_9ACTN
MVCAEAAGAATTGVAAITVRAAANTTGRNTRIIDLPSLSGRAEQLLLHRRRRQPRNLSLTFADLGDTGQEGAGPEAADCGFDGDFGTRLSASVGPTSQRVILVFVSSGPTHEASKRITQASQRHAGRRMCR